MNRSNSLMEKITILPIRVTGEPQGSPHLKGDYLLDTEVVKVESPSLLYIGGAFGTWKLLRHQNLKLEQVEDLERV